MKINATYVQDAIEKLNACAYNYDVETGMDYSNYVESVQVYVESVTGLLRDSLPFLRGSLKKKVTEVLK